MINLLLALAMATGSVQTEERKPDIKSVRAKIEDYYVFDDETGKWIWKEDYPEIMKKRYLGRINKFMKPRKDVLLEYDDIQKKRIAIKNLKTKKRSKAAVILETPIIRYIAD